MSVAMRQLKVAKVTVNMGVGEGGERLAKAEALLQQLTGQKPIKNLAKAPNPSFGIRKGTPIACKVTLRKTKAEEFLKKAFDAVERKVQPTSFDGEGNISFGIKEHIDIPGVRYDPAVGIFGMDVCLTLERPGYRIKRRRLQPKKIPRGHRVAKEEAIDFIKGTYQVNLEE